MAAITVKRKAYTRRAYTRRNGTHVKAGSVRAATFSIKDRGAPGRTPKNQRWYHPKVHMGWKKEQSAATRRKLALGAHKGDVLATARALIALSNVTVDAQTRRLARADAKYFLKKYQPVKEFLI